MTIKQIATICLAGILFSAPAWSSTASHEENARKYIMDMAYGAALEELNQAVKNHPKESGLYCNLGYVYYRQGRYLSAFMNYDRAVHLDPDNPVAFTGRGVSYVMSGEPELALKDLSRALSLAPEDAAVLYNLGNISAAMGQFEQAFKYYEKSVRLLTKDPLGFYNMGTAYLNTGRAGEAAAAFEKAVQADPDHAPSFLGRGLAWLKMEKLDQAVTHFDRAIELNPDLREAYAGRARAHALVCGCGKAADDLAAGISASFIYKIRLAGTVMVSEKKEITRKPVVTGEAYPVIDAVCDGGKAYFERGVAYFKTEKFQMALVDFNNAILQNPNHGKAFRYRGLVYQKLGDQGQAARDFKRASGLNPVSFDRECCMRRTVHLLPCTPEKTEGQKADAGYMEQDQSPESGTGMSQ